MQRTIYVWDEANLGDGAASVKIGSLVMQDFGNDGNHRDTAVAYTYDNNNGNLIERREFGEVIADEYGNYTDIGTDSRRTSLSYAVFPDGRISGYVSESRLYDHNGAETERSTSLFDNLDVGSVDTGNATEERGYYTGSKYISTHYAYDVYGNAISKTDGRGNTSTFIYDSFHLYPNQEINAKGHTILTEYDNRFGEVARTVDQNGFEYQAMYDGFGRVIERYAPDPTTASSVLIKDRIYDDTPGATSVIERQYLTDSNSIVVANYMDGFGNNVQTRVESETGFVVTDYIYGVNNLLTRQSLPYPGAGVHRTEKTTSQHLFIDYTHDALERVVNASNVVGNTTHEYDQWQEIVLDANANTKEYQYDAYGRLDTVIEHNREEIYSTQYAYNSRNDLVRITDANENIRNIKYDWLSRRTKLEDLHSSFDDTFSTWKYKFDSANNLKTVILPDGSKIKNKYDSLNRITQENYDGLADVEKKYVYDNCINGIGKLCKAKNQKDDVITTYGYDARGDTASELVLTSSLTFSKHIARDYAGNIISEIMPNGDVVSYGYSPAGNLNQITHSDVGSIINNITYAPIGHIEKINHTNGVTTENTYDEYALYRLTSRSTTNTNNETLFAIHYIYDAVGNITRIDETDRYGNSTVKTYAYDDLYRLTNAESSHGYQHSFSYDPIGNITLKSDVGIYEYGGTSEGGYANPHAATTIDGEYITYDVRGNQISAGNNSQFTWDYNNKLIRSTVNDITTAYTYNHQGQRTQKYTSTSSAWYPFTNYEVTYHIQKIHIYAGDALVATVVDNGESISTQHVHRDHLNSTRLVTDELGYVDQEYDYFPYGGERVSLVNRSAPQNNRFTGHDYDEETRPFVYGVSVLRRI